MSIYVFYCLEYDDRQPEFELYDGDDDVEARAAARGLLKRRSEYAAVEIWREGDPIGLVRREAGDGPRRAARAPVRAKQIGPRAPL